MDWLANVLTELIDKEERTETAFGDWSKGFHEGQLCAYRGLLDAIRPPRRDDGRRPPVRQAAPTDPTDSPALHVG